MQPPVHRWLSIFCFKLTFPHCFLETQLYIHIPYNKSVEKMAFAVDLGCKNVIRKVMDMENRRNYEKRRKILEDNIIRLMMDKNLTARALSIRIGKNEWYITRMLNRKIDPSLDTPQSRRTCSSGTHLS